MTKEEVKAQLEEKIEEVRAQLDELLDTTPEWQQISGEGREIVRLQEELDELDDMMQVIITGEMLDAIYADMPDALHDEYDWC